MSTNVAANPHGYRHQTPVGLIKICIFAKTNKNMNETNIRNKTIDIKFDVQASRHKNLGLMDPIRFPTTELAQKIVTSPMFCNPFNAPKLKTLRALTMDQLEMLRDIVRL